MERSQGCHGINGSIPFELYTDNSNGSSQNGSSETHVFRFTYPPVSQTGGSSVLQVDDAVNGTSFIIQESGVYAISASINSGGSAIWGISKNYITGGNTGYSSLAIANRLGETQITGSNVFGSFSTIVSLKYNDVIRVHSDGVPGSSGSNDNVRIVKLK